MFRIKPGAAKVEMKSRRPVNSDVVRRFRHARLTTARSADHLFGGVSNPPEAVVADE